jgi:hypothetical protein
MEHQSLSALAGQIKQLLIGSIILSAAVTALSLVNLGRLSVFMAPIAFLLTVIHHIILLHLLRRAQKDKSEATNVALAPTSCKTSIIACWILILVWIVVVLAVVIISVMVVSTNGYETWERLAGYFEIPFEVAEICVLVVLAFKCRKQRRKTLAELSVDKKNHSSTV